MRRALLTCAVTAALVSSALPGSALVAAGAAAPHVGAARIPVPPGVVVSDPSLSADGVWISFAGAVDGTSGLYRHNTATGETTRVTTGVEDRGGSVAQTSTSRDGNVIAWTRHSAGHSTGWDPASQVYVTDVRWGITRLVSSEVVDRTPGNEGSAEPEISEDGTHVVFTTRATDIIDKPFHGAGSGAGSDVVLAEVGGRGESLLRLVSPDRAGADFTEPSVNPDGTRIAFTRNASSSSASSVVLATRASGSDRVSHRDVAPGASPSLSADGSSLALVRPQREPGDRPRRATHLRTLAAGSEVQADVEDKGWSLTGTSATPVADRDGGTVLFALTRDTGTDLVVRDVDRGTTRTVARGVDGEAGHDLSADGDRVVHVSGGQLHLIDLGRLPAPQAPAPNAMWNPLVQRSATPARGRGYVLRVDPALWEPLRASRIERQWLRDGRVIAGASGLEYEITAADVGSEIKVRERLHVPGVPVGVATSRSYKVKPDLAQLRVPAKVARPRGRKVSLRVRVRTLPGSETYVKGAAVPQGRVTVKVGRRVVRATVGRNGWARLVLPAQRPGRHQLRVRHVGTPYVRAPAPKKVTLVVRRGR